MILTKTVNARKVEYKAFACNCGTKMEPLALEMKAFLANSECDQTDQIASFTINNLSRHFFSMGTNVEQWHGIWAFSDDLDDFTGSVQFSIQCDDLDDGFMYLAKAFVIFQAELESGILETETYDKKDVG
jgi:hypothetical protein